MKKEKGLSRRRFFLITGWIGLLSSFASSAAAAVRFLMPNVLYEPPKAFKMGDAKGFPKGSVTLVPERRVFVVNEKDGIQGLRVVSAICTHMGCTPKWVEANNRWECPCHGSVFDIKGNVIAGPAPKPLPWYKVTIGTDGKLFVDTNDTVKYDYSLKV